MDPFLGETRAFAFGITPKGWAPCDGRLMAVQQNQALFSLLGVAYGGDGITTFALPDLRGRTPLGYGGSVAIGVKDGSETVTLTAAEVPSHTHAVFASTAAANTAAPSTASLATLPTGALAYAEPSGSSTLAAEAVASSGGNQGHENMQPSLAVNWCIATTGIFPSRS
ncbi:MAG: phage tail protein [Comamonadaceae bacterium]|jgi:microcystin-dependent protein|nr:MAG: phage tail protein [Comamonadaceae bacterium]